MGVTSPPYVLLIVGLLKSGIEPMTALRVASAAGLAAMMLAMSWLMRSISLDYWGQALALSAIASIRPVVEQASNGVETGWAIGVGTLLITFCYRKWPIAAAAAAGLLPWLRPDLSPTAGIMFLAAIWRQPFEMRARAVAVAVSVFLPWALWLWNDTGNLIPQTMLAKAAFFATGCRTLGDRFLLTGLAVASWLILTLPLSGVAVLSLFRSGWATLGAVGSFFTLLAYFAFLPDGLSHNNYRYLYPVAVPWLGFGIAMILRRDLVIWRVVIVAMTFSSLMLWPWRDWSERFDREETAEWIRSNIDPSATLMVQDAGVFAVRTNNRLVDFVGLKTASNIEIHRRLTWPTCGRDRGLALAAIASRSRADYLIVTTEWDSAFFLVDELERAGVQLAPLRIPPEGQRGYKVYRIVRGA